MAQLLIPSIGIGLLCAIFLQILRQIHSFYSRRVMMRQNGCQAPNSLLSIDPFFGLDAVLKASQSRKQNRRNISMKEQLDTNGSTFIAKEYGRSILCTIEPKNLQSIFATNFESYGVQPIRLFEFEPFVGKGIMTTDGALWANSRALIRPTFAKTQIANLESLDGHVSRLIALIPESGETVDLQPLFARLALDTSTEFLFGESVGSLTDQPSLDAKEFLRAYNIGQAGVGKRMHFPKWNFFTRDPAFWQSCKTLAKFVDRYVEIAISREEEALIGETKVEGPKVLVHELARESKDKIYIRNQLLNVFLPAHDAAAVALTNVFFNLARHPSVYSTLRAEILSAFPQGKTRDITYESLRSLTYLQAVLSETFRLYPVTGTMARMALRDTILPVGGGPMSTAPVFVRKGTCIRTSFYALHRRKDLWGDDAHEWRPERWTGLRPPHWAYLPFGGGPRICPGQQLATTETAYTVVRIMLEFSEIENRDPVWEFVERYRITTESANGAQVAFKVDI